MLNHPPNTVLHLFTYFGELVTATTSFPCLYELLYLLLQKR